MNKKFLKHYMETEPEGTSKKYIFLVDNQDIAMNIVMSGYQAVSLVTFIIRVSEKESTGRKNS